ncbi:hypothetical protein F5148DRAFT_538042 [Russula earlei]|uniref:Uncharacterized protein n=1 Tax=Russula earlei TaxID=71964 RepID=A0ACC0UG58_9AGAM|nr:hypothetical protein F5148DRAFT_538042 [Russula earlei]
MSVSTTPVSPSQCMRVAIAFAALKYKPPDRSIQSYTLDLKHYFCRSATRSISEESDSWRKRALGLEAELKASRAAATQREGVLEDETEATSTSKRKGTQTTKRPLKSETRRPRPLLIPSTITAAPKTTDILQSGNTWPRLLLGKDLRLFSSLRALDDISALVTTTPVSPHESGLVAAALMRCLEALHALLVRAMSSVPGAPEDATPQEILEGIEGILPQILCRAVPVLNHAYVDPFSAARLQGHAKLVEDEPIHPYDRISTLDLVLGRVTTEFLVPAIRALVPCTLVRTEHVLSSLWSESPKKDFADGAQLLSLVVAVLGILPDPQYIALIPYAQLTEAQRIYRIARKEALHFLCDAALHAFRRPAPAPLGSSEYILRAALAEALGNLALTQTAREGGSRLDTVEEYRVMVVLERAWSLGLRIGHINGNVNCEKVGVNDDDVHEQHGDVSVMEVLGTDITREE